MRKNSKNEKVIRAMAIGISAMLMASSPLTALAAEGEGNSSEGNEDKNITVTPEAGVCDQAEAAAKDADKAVEGAEKSAADVKAEVVDKVAAGDVKDAGGKDLSQDILDANAKVEDKTVEDGSSLKDAESAVENADTALGVAEANDKLSDAELNKAADAAANAGQTAAEAKDAMQASQDKVNGQIENIKDAASITDANAAYEEVKTTVDQAQADFDAKLGEYNTAKAAYEEAAKKLADYEKAYEDAVNSADANADAAATELKAAQENAEALAQFLNRTNPAHVVNFSMFLHKEVPLYQDIRQGTFVPADELETIREEYHLIERIAPEKAGANILYDGFHDFIHVRVRGHLPGDKEKMLAKLNGIIQEYEGKEPVYSFVQGECPDLEYCDDGKAVWDMDRKTS